MKDWSLKASHVHRAFVRDPQHSHTCQCIPQDGLCVNMCVTNCYDTSVNWNKVPSQHCAHCRLQTVYSWNRSGWVSFNCQERDNWGATEVWAILITYRWTEKHGETIFVAETVKSKMNVTVMSIPLICFVTQIWSLVLEEECRCSWLCYRVIKGRL